MVAKVDAFAARVQVAQGTWLRCARGCDRCCRTSRSAWAVELEALRRYVAGLSAARQAELRARRADAEVVAGRRCVFLDGDGACAVYAARPILCRTHGPMVRRGKADAMWCELNFAGIEPGEVPSLVAADGVLDLDRLDALLSVVNRRYDGEAERPLGFRGGAARAPLHAALEPE